MTTQQPLDLQQTATEIIMTRTFAAPRELVFAAFTKPEHLAKWWGPTGFTLTTHHYDATPGGTWRFTMHGPDGRDYENNVTFLEVAPPSRLVFKHGGAADVEPVSHTTVVTLDAVDARTTRMTFRMTFVDAARKDFVVNTHGAIEGGRETMARLGEFLESQVG